MIPAFNIKVAMKSFFNSINQSSEITPQTDTIAWYNRYAIWARSRALNWIESRIKKGSFEDLPQGTELKKRFVEGLFCSRNTDVKHLQSKVTDLAKKGSWQMMSIAEQILFTEGFHVRVKNCWFFFFRDKDFPSGGHAASRNENFCLLLEGNPKNVVCSRTKSRKFFWIEGLKGSVQLEKNRSVKRTAFKGILRVWVSCSPLYPMHSTLPPPKSIGFFDVFSGMSLLCTLPF